MACGHPPSNAQAQETPQAFPILLYSASPRARVLIALSFITARARARAEGFILALLLSCRPVARGCELEIAGGKKKKNKEVEVGGG
jgi:hypothetical protein